MNQLILIWMRLIHWWLAVETRRSFLTGRRYLPATADGGNERRPVSGGRDGAICHRRSNHPSKRPLFCFLLLLLLFLLSLLFLLLLHKGGYLRGSLPADDNTIKLSFPNWLGFCFSLCADWLDIFLVWLGSVLLDFPQRWVIWIGPGLFPRIVSDTFPATEHGFIFPVTGISPEWQDSNSCFIPGLWFLKRFQSQTGTLHNFPYHALVSKIRKSRRRRRRRRRKMIMITIQLTIQHRRIDRILARGKRERFEPRAPSWGTHNWTRSWMMNSNKSTESTESTESTHCCRWTAGSD